ncbi:MAG: efflux RND transporter periplasmic adaptor subunit [Acidobacteriota bacterium]
MKRILRLAVVAVVLGGVGYGVVAATRDGKDAKSAFTLIKVERGTIVDKALATGQIVPEQEIQVKSQISGIVKECFAEVGDQVTAGQPLFAIIPDPTPLELNEVERGVQLAEVAYDRAAADYQRNNALAKDGILSKETFDAAKQSFDQARIQLDLARERLALTKEGKIQRAKGGVDSVIRAPASGTVLKRHVNPGDPVVPLTTYQAGTPLMTMADMGTLMFKGTVDEIDVGKLREGMPVRIKIGALPDARVTGRLTRIAPKATEKEGTTLFDVEAAIEKAEGITLRAGYSANADVIIQEKADVLLLPERLVSFEKEKAFVELPAAKADAPPVKREIKTGLSDGIKLEVVAGLAEGDQVVQRPPKKIE